LLRLVDLRRRFGEVQRHDLNADQVQNAIHMAHSGQTMLFLSDRAPGGLCAAGRFRQRNCGGCDLFE
jgi:hypothetical protein